MKHALITGASEGIGHCFAEVFAKRGHDLILVARSKEKLTDFADELKARFQSQVTVIPMDLIPENAAEQLFYKVAELEIHVDILVNNAGKMQVEPFCSSDITTLNNLMHLNVRRFG